MTEHEINIFNRIKCEVNEVIDVGAEIDISYYREHNTAQYHLFEPISFHYYKLIELTKDIPNIKVNNSACGDIQTIEKIYLNSSSINYRSGSKNVDNKIETINIIRLDNYIENNNLQNFDFIKIDTEGYEYKVLKGLGEYLNKFKFIQVEYGWTYHDMRMNGRHLMLQDIFSLLSEYHAVKIETKQNYELYNSALEDYVYCNYMFYRPEYKALCIN